MTRLKRIALALVLSTAGVLVAGSAASPASAQPCFVEVHGTIPVIEYHYERCVPEVPPLDTVDALAQCAIQWAMLNFQPCYIG